MNLKNKIWTESADLGNDKNDKKKTREFKI